ncbi:D-glycero-beta-D-manno-heptose-7-phosphate kinase [Tenacibaculum retecalamus]|uniref:D-glycero-beta-D-manno-heptose-7-phosphate kinase n=1 Tax=Tenacibaculum retecalamus TaxID=3018315 RepID=UPI0023D8EAC1|nr:D-glycero-beta-D-manno-heptose-7-phosphate kinase [Tenacibaculum retecalamus]WBX71665.1 D-glycero-beta-D-manno-heptose-7-phosphate kinase [Tenacibaculum retecalamus]
MKSILVIGDIIVDNYLVGSIDRISPEAPVPIVKIDKETSVLGGAGNVINNLLAFGAKADIISVIGDNENFSIIDKLLKDKNINTNHLIQEKNRTLTVKTRVLSSNQQIVRYDKEDIKEISDSTSNKIIKLFESIIKNYNIVILSDYGKGVLTEKITKNIIKTAKKLKIKVLVDPKGYDYSKYSGAYLLTPNKKEASIVTNFDIDNKNLETAIRKLKSDYKLSISIITLSHDGIAVYNKELKTFPTKTKEVYDVTGAGDTVIAAIAFKLAHKQTIEEAIEFANLAAGVVVGKTGVATATIDEIYAQQYNIKTKNEIKKIVDQLKKQNKKIVFTNGCFDILHLGHIKYLEKAKKAGDVLIIGINSDASVKRLKGKDRPINNEFDRSYLINSLKTVDYTVIFNEDTPYELIKIIKPDILVKGGDYKNKKVIGSDIVKKTKLIEFIEGKSTTELINKIKK